jgi:hypothetical protein
VTSPVITIDPGVVINGADGQIADADRLRVPPPMSGGDDPDDPTVGAAHDGIDTVAHVRENMAQHSKRHADGQKVAAHLLTSQDEDNQAKIANVAGMSPKDQSEMMRGLAKDGLSMLTQAMTAFTQGFATAANGLIQATSTSANMATQIGTSLAKSVQDAAKGTKPDAVPVHAGAESGPPGGGVGGVGAEATGAQTAPAAARYPYPGGRPSSGDYARTEGADRDSTQTQTVGYMPSLGGMGAGGLGGVPRSATATEVRRFTVVSGADVRPVERAVPGPEQATPVEHTLLTPVMAKIEVA